MTNFLKNKSSKRIYSAGRKIADLLYPPRCLVCHGLLEHGEKIHQECKKQLHIIEDPVCMRCGKPLESERWEYCFDCSKKLKERAEYCRRGGDKEVRRNGGESRSLLDEKESKDIFCQGKALYLYKGGMKQAMYRFKYSNKREYARFFGEEAAMRYGQWIRKNQIEAIVPVPLYPGKKRKRGYNQAEVFARELSWYTGIPIESKLIVRMKDTQPMKNLDDVERKNNMKGAFQIGKMGVKYKKILVVDDIYTTGSTIEAVAEVLSQTGVQSVFSICVCIGKGC